MSEKSLAASAVFAVSLSAVVAVCVSSMSAQAQSQGPVSGVAAPAESPAGKPSKLDVDPAVSAEILQRAATMPKPSRRRAGETAAADGAAPVADQPQAAAAPQVKASEPAASKPAATEPDALAAADEPRDQAPVATAARVDRDTHRLQAPFPDYNVVVCLAGCAAGKESIIYFEKRTRTSDLVNQDRARPAPSPLVRVAMNETAPVDSAVSKSMADGQGPITCVAGCYSTPKSYSGRRGVAIETPNTPPVSGRVVDGTWMTVTKAAADVPESAYAGRATGRAGRGKRQKDGGSDWFTKRF